MVLFCAARVGNWPISAPNPSGRRRGYWGYRFHAGAELASLKETHCGLTMSIAVPSREGGTPQIAAG
jgi:hypothetical protein